MKSYKGMKKTNLKTLDFRCRWKTVYQETETGRLFYSFQDRWYGVQAQDCTEK